MSILKIQYYYNLNLTFQSDLNLNKFLLKNPESPNSSTFRNNKRDNIHVVSHSSSINQVDGELHVYLS